MRGVTAVLALLAACFDPSLPANIACGPGGGCPDGLFCEDGMCVGAPGTESDAANTLPTIDGAAPADAVAIAPIPGAGVWSSDGSELRRGLVTSVSRQTFTFATWYRSDETGAMLLGSGVASNRQTFLWAGSDSGAPFFQHQDGDTYAAGVDTWPHLGQWVHLVIAVDLTDPLADRRVRYWVNGEPDATASAGGMTFPMGLDLFTGATVQHTLGNKHDGAFDWTGSLANTYLIFGHALEPSHFITTISPGTVRSIEYTGPVTAESVHFDYAGDEAGANAFPGQPDWDTQQVSIVTDDLPY
jgi:hypothetical protein